MINQGQFKNKRALVVGLARSGVSVANLLHSLGAKVWVTDNKDDETTRRNAAQLRSKEIEVELGRHSEEFIADKDLLITSPGVPDAALPISRAKEFKVPVISEIELAWRLCPATVIAVTGSNGKTTVTTLIGNIIEKSGSRAFTLGNIGRPFCAEVDKLKGDDFVSLEVSSFQLETIGKFKPEIALILNLSRNHLDRHKDMAEYIAAKKRIFMNQDESDFLVLNADDARVKEFGKEARAKKIYFKSGGGLNPNQAAVSAVAGILGISKEIVSCVFRDFKGIEHRMEYLCGTGPVRFINDSKATTAESTLWALRNIPDEVILIAGGRDKGVDYAIIREEARRKVRRLILIGEAKDKIAAALEGAVDIEKAATLEEAVEKANFFAKPKDTVLLSPMCSSFDMFRDYEERGRCFKQAVAGLRKKAKVNLS